MALLAKEHFYIANAHAKTLPLFFDRFIFSSCEITDYASLNLSADTEQPSGLRRRVAGMDRKELEDLFLRSQDEILVLKKSIREHENNERVSIDESV